jgi:hypothetical protein
MVSCDGFERIIVNCGGGGTWHETRTIRVFVVVAGAGQRGTVKGIVAQD